MQIILIPCFGEQRPQGIQARALARLLRFSFSIDSSPFCFLLTEFHYAFSMSSKILCLLIFPSLSQWVVDGLQVQISQEVIHSFGALRPGGRQAFGTSFFMPALLSMLKHLFFSFFVLFHSCFSHAQVFGKTLVLNGTSFFRQCDYTCT